MSLEKFGEELKETRVEKNISLADISTETRINIKYLEAIERGEFHILPQTYVRAFLREYAQVLNLDPEEIMQRYNDARQENIARKQTEPVQPQQTAIRESILEGNFGKWLTSLSPVQRNIALGSFAAAILAVIILLANMAGGPDPDSEIKEVPFDKVVHESEATSVRPQAVVVDSSRIFVAPQKDSLRLEITTLDSVWISLLIDEKKGEEYLFAPNRKKTWSAKERFVITMGNAGGATFRLNSKNIGPLGKPGTVVRNAIITEANLKN
jgi:transcriptional regulator with XRE-family HTH domain